MLQLQRRLDPGKTALLALLYKPVGTVHYEQSLLKTMQTQPRHLM